MNESNEGSRLETIMYIVVMLLRMVGEFFAFGAVIYYAWNYTIADVMINVNKITFWQGFVMGLVLELIVFAFLVKRNLMDEGKEDV